MSSMQQWAFLAMQDKEGKLSSDQSSAFQELKNRAGQAGQTLAQYVEPALAVGSGMAGHLAGIAVGAGGIGMGVDAAESAYNRTQDWMTYRPRTQSGQAGLEWLGDKSQVVGDAVNKAVGQGVGAVISAIPGQTAEAAPAIQAAITNKGVSKSVEDYITETTGSETAGTLASWVPGAVELVAGGKGIMNAAKLEMGDIGGQGMGNQRGAVGGVQQSLAGGAKKVSGTTTLPAFEFDALKQSGDNYETIYSGTSSSQATEIAPYGKKRKDGDQNIFGGIFGSQSKGAADSHGDTMQEMLVSKDKIISDGDFTDFVNDRDGGYAQSEKLITDIVGEHKKTDLTPDEAEELLDYVTGDKSVFSNRYDENTGEWSNPPDMGVDRFEEIMGNYLDTEQGASTGEIVWDLQAMKGEMARRLGYDAVGMMDEHGESVLVLNGILKSNK
jgi:hypothetical protein